MLTPKQLEARRKKWGRDANARRIERYAEDEAYRRKVVENTRANYRKGRTVVTVDCRERLNNLTGFGILRDAIDKTTGETQPLRVYPIKAVADFLDVTAETICRWRRDGRWPKAALRIKDVRQGHSFTDVWFYDEVRAVAKVYGAHTSVTPYYHKSHADTRRAIFEAANTAREAAGITKDES